jgi:sugar lactone lactonase YvrE
MKHKLYLIISVLIIAVLAFGSVRVLAQGCPLSGSQSSHDQSLNSRADRNGDCDYPLPPSSPAVELAQPSVIPALGAPGFSLSYASTIGDPTVGYFEDTTHLNFPYGVGTDGSHVWIADSYGNRALKFSNDGSVQQVKAGFSSAVSGTELEWVSDVAVDSLGQIWLVDRGANHVARFDSAGNFLGDLGQPWVVGAGTGTFSAPESIAFDSAGNAYVSDGNNHRLQVFDPLGNWINTIGVTNVPGSGNNYFNYPRHITIDDTDQLYVADSSNHRVQVFDVSQPLTITYVATLGITGIPGDDSGHLSTPSGVAVDASRIYVADTGNSRIQIFDRTTRTYFATLGSGSGQGDAELDLPTDVVVDSAGNLYVADYNNTRVQQFDPTWDYARTYGSTRVPYLPDGHYNSPLVSTDAEDNILITEEWGHRLIKLNLDGILQWSFGEAGVSGWDNEHLSSPTRVAADSSGNIYVPEGWNCRVQIISPDGEYLNTLGISCGSGADQINGPRGVTMGGNGLIYIADSENQRVQIFDIQRLSRPLLSPPLAIL